MAKHVLDLADRKLVDSITSAEELGKRLPQRMTSFFEGIEEKRELVSTVGHVGRFTKKSGFTDDGSMQHFATVPLSVFSAMLEIDPEFGTNQEKFLAWLRRNPQYGTTERIP
jgi:hypothetical protein